MRMMSVYIVYMNVYKNAIRAAAYFKQKHMGCGRRERCACIFAINKTSGTHDSQATLQIGRRVSEIIFLLKLTHICLWV